MGRADEPARKEPREGGYGVISWWEPAGKERPVCVTPIVTRGGRGGGYAVLNVAALGTIVQ